MQSKAGLFPGTLELLILRTVARGPLHGYGIAQSIKRDSDEVFSVEEGSLYPALQRLLVKGLVRAEWKLTEHNKRGRFYSITPAGEKQLGIAIGEFHSFVHAMALVLREA